MKTVISIIILFMLATPAHAEWFTWDKTNTQLHAPLTLLMVADMGQTLWAQEHYWTQGAHEQNQILGKYPSKNEIREYFVISYIAITGMTYILPDKWSHVFQSSIITLEVYTVNENRMLGIGVKF
jgi:hypothetical protein